MSELFPFRSPALQSPMMRWSRLLLKSISSWRGQSQFVKKKNVCSWGLSLSLSLSLVVSSLSPFLHTHAHTHTLTYTHTHTHTHAHTHTGVGRALLKLLKERFMRQVFSWRKNNGKNTFHITPEPRDKN